MKKINVIHNEQEIPVSISSPYENFIRELHFVYWAEKQFSKILNRAQRAASTTYLKASFKGHAEATQHHCKRLERIFELLDKKSNARKSQKANDLCETMIRVIRETKKNSLDRELALIDAVTGIEAFEMECYRALLRMAKDSGNGDLAFLLEETLTEEQEAGETFLAVREDTLVDDIFGVTPLLNELPDEETEQLEAV